MKNKNKEIVFSNGDPMKPVFCVDGKKYYTDKDVERLIEEYDDRIRVARGNFNLVETLNSFVERDLKNARRALWLARAEWARSSALSYHLIESHPDKDVAETYKRKANKWEKAKDKCLKKAEECK